MEEWLGRTRRAAFRFRRILLTSSLLLAFSVIAFEYVRHSLPRTRWGLVPLVAVWASLTVAVVSAIAVFYNWRGQRVIRQGIANAGPRRVQANGHRLVGHGSAEARSNKRMKLTRLAAAPGTPTQGAAAWARGQGTGPTASQLMRGVGRTQARSESRRSASETQRNCRSGCRRLCALDHRGRG